MVLGSIEGGGTKFICAVGDADFRVHDMRRISTTTPEETMNKVVDYFKQFDNLEAIGAASFGPIDSKINSPRYGYINQTVHTRWSDFNFVGTLKKNFNIPISWTTDVNGSAYGEYLLSSLFNEQVDSIVYYTIGTGINAGVVIEGKLVGETGQPEMGHISVKRHPADENFSGMCTVHQDCLEGLASGPTFEGRTGKKGENIPITDPVWNTIAFYIAQAALDATLMFRPNKIVFGGGVANEMFLKKVRQEFSRQLNSYIDIGNLTQYITMPLAKNNGSATVGNFGLALNALKSK